jgi:hypothetical protein
VNEISLHAPLGEFNPDREYLADDAELIRLLDCVIENEADLLNNVNNFWQMKAN